jgi:hypothetical protein
VPDLITNELGDRLRAERHCGQFLDEMEKAGERDRGQGGNRRSPSPETTVKTLDEMGITRDQSSQWQKLAAAK